jgi:hypothetical protein
LREIRTAGSTSGVWKRDYGAASEAPPDERGVYSSDFSGHEGK